MKYFILFSLLFSSLYAKDCYTNKQLRKTICYYKYHDRKNIYNPKSDERYYQIENGSIYAISDKIEVKFKAVGAIISVLDDYEVDLDTTDNDDMGDFRIGFNQYDLEFWDKKRNDRFIFRVKKPDAMFIILRKLNALTLVQSAKPLKERKFTVYEINKRSQLAKERRAKASSSGSGSGSGAKGGASKGFQGGNFLKGGVK